MIENISIYRIFFVIELNVVDTLKMIRAVFATDIIAYTIVGVSSSDENFIGGENLSIFSVHLVSKLAAETSTPICTFLNCTQIFFALFSKSGPKNA